MYLSDYISNKNVNTNTFKLMVTVYRFGHFREETELIFGMDTILLK